MIMEKRQQIKSLIALFQQPGKLCDKDCNVIAAMSMPGPAADNAEEITGG